MKLGEILVKKLKISKDIINEALEDQKVSGKMLGEILVLKNILTKTRLSQALDYQKKLLKESIKINQELENQKKAELLKKDEVFIQEKTIELNKKVELKKEVLNTEELELKNKKLLFKKKKMKDILHGYFDIDNSIMDEALFKQQRVFNGKKKLGEILIEDGLVGVDTIFAALAIQKDFEYVNYTNIKDRINYQMYKDDKIYKHFNQDSYITLLYSIIQAKAMPIFWDIDENNNDILVIAITDPDNNDAQILIDTFRHNDLNIKVIMTSGKLYTDFMLRYKELTIDELEAFSKKIDDIKPEEFLKYLLIYSILHDVSDIHISPAGNNSARIAVRTLGTVETLFYLSFDHYNKLITVVKNNADMKAETTRTSQDGRIDGKKLLKDVKINVNRVAKVDNSYGINENLLEYDFSNVSFRISTYPTATPYELNVGESFEKVVIRVLNLSAGLVELNELGLSKQVVEELNFAKSRLQGLILIVGPTGSGKSTTLYSLLSSINSIKKNIITFEDPVEMRQLYWAQGQRNLVTNNKDMNFDYLEARKSILRQDPDIILMGEIRDEESASFAVESSNTGHLVFSTLHANTAAAAFERIKKLGVQELEIASSIISILSQRLMRKICPLCAIRRKITDQEVNAFKRGEFDIDKLPPEVYSHNKEGCKYCNHKGYIGRTTIAEIIPVTSTIKQAIVNGAPDFEIRELASKLNYKTIIEDGLELMEEGKVGIEDVINLINS